MASGIAEIGWRTIVVLSVALGWGVSLTAWERTVVTASGERTDWQVVSMVDRADDTHFFYLGPEGDEIIHRWGRPGSWSEESILTESNPGAGLRVEEGPDGRLHLVVHQMTYPDNEIVYLVKAGGSWTLETVAPARGWGVFTALAVSSDGTPHLLFRRALRQGGEEVTLAQRDPTTGWELEAVSTDVPHPTQAQLRISPSGDLHAVWAEGSTPDTGTLVYAEADAEQWVLLDLATVDLTHPQSYDLLLQGEDLPHVTYQQSTEVGGTITETRIRHARRPAAGWEFSTVATLPGSHSSAVSLALPPGASPLVQFTEEESDGEVTMHVAKKSGATWERQTVETGLQIKPTSRLHVTSEGHLGYGYFEIAERELRWLRRVPLEPRMEMEITPTEARLRWQTTSGVTYQLQSSTDLTTWQNEGAAFVATGTASDRTISVIGRTRKFFRLIANDEPAGGAYFAD